MGVFILALINLSHKMFDKLGLEISIINTGSQDEYTFKGFLQPLLYKNKLYLDGIRTELGYDGQHTYLLISPPNFDLSVVNNSTSYLMFNSSKYTINHTEKVYLGQKWLYNWSVVSRV